MVEMAEARREHAPQIARLIMQAMTDECCLHFCGKGHGLDDFYAMMTLLVEREDSQYSYLNTVVALDGSAVVGVAVAYDGGRLHELRRAFVEMAKVYLDVDHSNIDDETQSGELYLDSLAVLPAYRRKGIARRLVVETKRRADLSGLPCVGLLVDADNDAGAKFYDKLGFRFVDNSRWGGHAMRHLVL